MSDSVGTPGSQDSDSEANGRVNGRLRCVIVTGRPGAGKTTLAKKLGERLRMPVISRDEIKEGYVNTRGVSHNQLPAETNALVSDLFFEIVNRYLAGNISVVIEAAFQHDVWKARLTDILELASPWIVICSLDEASAASRHLQRGLEDEMREYYHGDNRVAHFMNRDQVPPPESYEAPQLNVPTVIVSTEKDYVPSIDEIVRQILSFS
jgi:predicted kinase